MKAILLISFSIVVLASGYTQTDIKTYFKSESAELLPTDLVPSITASNPVEIGSAILNFELTRDSRVPVDFKCNKKSVKVTFSGEGLLPPVQNHFCDPKTKSQIVVLSLETEWETEKVNPIEVNSFDKTGNLAAMTSTFNLPIDSKPPVITIASESNVKLSEKARFIVEAEDKNMDIKTLSFLPSSGGVTSQKCSLNLCVVEVAGAEAGPFKLLLPAGSAFDLAGNTNVESVNEEIFIKS